MKNEDIVQEIKELTLENARLNIFTAIMHIISNNTGNIYCTNMELFQVMQDELQRLKEIAKGEPNAKD